MKVLVIEDEKVTRVLLEQYLRKEGYEVDVATGGKEALAKMEHETFPLILSDIHTADLDGLSLLCHLKAMGSPSVVILMTAFGSLDGAVRAMHEGAFDYLSKPLHPDN